MEAAEAPILSNRIFVIVSGSLLTLALLYLVPICFVMYPNNDSGLVWQGADLLHRGGLLYRDMHAEMFPGSFLLLALCFKLFGPTWLTCAFLATGTFLCIGALILILSRQLIEGWMVFLPAVMFLVLGPAMCPYNSHHWDALMFFLLMSLILIGTLESPVPRLCLAFVAGLTGGLTVLCFQAFVPAVLGSFVTAALLLRATKSPQSQAARTIAVQLMGFLSIMVALLLYLSRTKTLPQMMNSTIWFILNQYGPSNEVPYGYSNWVDLLINSYDRIAGILAGLSFEIVVWAPLVVALSAIAWFARTGSPGTGNCKQQRIILWLVLAYGLWIAELHRPDIKRLFWGSQLLIILTFFFLQQFVYRLRSFRLSLRVICLFILTGLVLDASWFLKWHRLPACVLDTRRGPVSLSNDLPIVEELQKLTVPYEKVLVYPYDTSINFLTKTCFPSIYPFLQYHYHSPEQIGDTVRDMEKSKVRYVVWNMRVNVDSFKEFGFPNYEPVGRDERIMERYLLENYDSVKLYGHYRLMRRKGG